ncbi:MAG: 2-phospho-L-lactate guanylyltransferase [Anaerolineaceae bacterium]|nr:2-phospho-L-lactate guanylyltransferase [Anaerolineaceae bacterium]
MSLWAIVPVKPLAEGKSRLSAILSNDERVKLNRTLLQQALSILSSLPEIERILVINRDPDVAAEAATAGAQSIPEEDWGLNSALTQATSMAIALGVDRLLILPADLPLLRREGVQTLLSLTGTPPEVIIAPDRWGRGTNALYVSPAGLIDYCFGDHSLAGHTEQARALGARVVYHESPDLAMDLDTPDDFLAIQSILAREANSDHKYHHRLLLEA